MSKKRLRQIRFILIYILVGLLAIRLFQELVYEPQVSLRSQVPYSQFRSDLERGRVKDVSLEGDRILYTCCTDSEEDTTYNVVAIQDPDLIDALVESGVTFRRQVSSSTALSTLLGWVIPLLPVVLIGYFLFRLLGRGGSGVLSLGKSRAHEIAGEMTGVTFEDVGGVDEVEFELVEIIEFLKDPTRFTRLGAKLPKGVLMVGPPGTGKTLLARATAGEAGVPFFSISGAGFVEMFVGVGAARVRDLFEQAKKRAPCIIFIDEIDALGQSRSTAGAIRTNDEREQTLNQLLAEMDGFEPNQGVVIMAATNRPEVLDAALLRPGRFDRQVQVTHPTEAGRRQILGIHAELVPLADESDLDRLARITPGFSGADLANIVNEAALLAVRYKRDQVTMDDFDLAIERVVAGLQRSMPLNERVRRRVAYHEGGHALVACVLPHTDPVHKVSIIPTAKGALGYTLQMPEEDQYLLDLDELNDRLTVMLGGRAAELLVQGKPSTGAANDLERATELARRMVTELGMTDALGPVRYAAKTGAVHLGASGSLSLGLSPETAGLVDREVRRLVEEAQTRAVDLLRAHEDALHEVARVLLESEVISGEEIEAIVRG